MKQTDRTTRSSTRRNGAARKRGAGLLASTGLAVAALAATPSAEHWSHDPDDHVHRHGFEHVTVLTDAHHLGGPPAHLGTPWRHA